MWVTSRRSSLWHAKTEQSDLMESRQDLPGANENPEVAGVELAGGAVLKDAKEGDPARAWQI